MRIWQNVRRANIKKKFDEFPIFDINLGTDEQNSDDGELDRFKKKQIILFTASWCSPCQKFKTEEVPKLEKSNWKIGNTKDCHIRIYDIDENPDLFNKYNGNKVPLFVLIENEKETARVEGFQTANQVAQWWSKK